MPANAGMEVRFRLVQETLGFELPPEGRDKSWIPVDPFRTARPGDDGWLKRKHQLAQSRHRNS